MKKAILVIAFALLAVISFAQKTTTDHNKETDFSKLKSFFLVGGRVLHYNNIPSQDKAIGKYIDSSLNTDLKEKGFVKKNSVDACDFVVTYNAGVITKEELDQVEAMPAHQFGYGEAYSASNTWYEATSNAWWTEKTQAGTLVIDIYDRKTKKLIWRSNSESDLADKNIYKLIDNAIKKAMKQFPPKK